MIRSAAARLTLWYLAIIMIVSAIFSVVLYRVSYGQLAENAVHQRQAINRIPLPMSMESRRAALTAYLDEQLTDARDELMLRILLLNAGLLLFGGVAAYGLARRTLRPIQDALEAQGRFTADASHELRTPLTAMRSEIEVALRDKALPAADARALLGSNLEEIAKLESLSAGLLRLARSENGLDPASLSTVKVQDLFDGAAERFAPIIAKRGLNLDIQAGSETVTGDRDSLLELIAILLDNAIKYSPDGTAIKLSSQLTGTTLRLKVRDEGQGIAASDLPYIFNRFYRSDRSRTRNAAGGYGLGLSIAKRIVDLHHGQISATSKPGSGTTFTVKLPTKPVAESAGWLSELRTQLNAVINRLRSGRR